MFGVVAAVGEQHVRTVAFAAAQLRDRIDRGDRVLAIVLVRGAQQHRQRDAAAVAD